MFQIIDPDFDQFDNDFLEFRFKMLDYENDEYKEFDIPIVPCETDLIPDFQKKYWYPG